MPRGLLSTCGLNSTDQTVFLLLIKLGPRSGGMLAKAAGLNRSTVYSSLTSLLRQGFITRYKQGKVTMFSPVDPVLLEQVIKNTAQHRYSEIMLASSRLPSELQALTKAKTSDYAGIEVTVFESVQAVYAHLEQTLESGEFSAIFNPQTACTGDGKKVMVKFLKHTAKTKVHIREIIVAGPLAKWYRQNIKNPNHKIMEITSSLPLVSDMILSNDSVIITNYGATNEFAVRLTNKEFYQSMLSIFEILWQSLR